jgi:hypothetical protein
MKNPMTLLCENRGEQLEKKRFDKGMEGRIRKEERGREK